MSSAQMDALRTQFTGTSSFTSGCRHTRSWLISCSPLPAPGYWTFPWSWVKRGWASSHTVYRLFLA
jgi:hypothetical protein